VVRRINLVPPNERPRTTTDFGLLLVLVVIVLVVAALAFGYYSVKSNLSGKQDELTGLQQQNTQLQGQLQTLQHFEVLQTKRVAAEQVVQGIYSGRTLVSDILDEMSLVIPDNVWFLNLNLSTANPTQTTAASSSSATSDNVFALDGNTYSMDDVAQVLIRLQLVNGLKDSRLSSAGQAKGTVDPTKHVVGFSAGGSVVNTQPSDTPLPISQVEVQTP
jgi:Tfp pilus assembly protein PilN